MKKINIYVIVALLIFAIAIPALAFEFGIAKKISQPEPNNVAVQGNEQTEPQNIELEEPGQVVDMNIFEDIDLENKVDTSLGNEALALQIRNELEKGIKEENFLKHLLAEGYIEPTGLDSGDYSVIVPNEDSYIHRNDTCIIPVMLSNISENPDYVITQARAEVAGQVVYSNNNLLIKRHEYEIIPLEIPRPPGEADKTSEVSIQFHVI